MATHYNEPVDIASSSLTEEGTVFGGTKNLLKGLENLIKLYNPEVIGVSTTCLAETIGEDVPAIIKQFKDEHPEVTATIIPVVSPGYSGSQYEGFFRALHAIVRHVPMNATPNNVVNIITGHLSAADTRALKLLLDASGLEYVLLPDLSQNLDGGHEDDYNRLPQYGTTLARIGLMAGARMTLELAPFCPEGYSPGAYLRDTYGVPLLRMNLPVGLRDTDAFIATLEALGGAIPATVREERARYLDAMIDAHKYNAQSRVAVFGEPDMVLALVRASCENGAVPVVAATGSRCAAFEKQLAPDMAQATENPVQRRLRHSQFCRLCPPLKTRCLRARPTSCLAIPMAAALRSVTMFRCCATAFPSTTGLAASAHACSSMTARSASWKPRQTPCCSSPRAASARSFSTNTSRMKPSWKLMPPGH